MNSLESVDEIEYLILGYLWVLLVQSDGLHRSRWEGMVVVRGGGKLKGIGAAA